MFRWLLSRWDARSRRIDLEILWPVIRETEPDLDRARSAFGVHCLMDPAWQRAGLDVIEETIKELR
jgi:hypothetical protein